MYPPRRDPYLSLIIEMSLYNNNRKGYGSVSGYWTAAAPMSNGLAVHMTQVPLFNDRDEKGIYIIKSGPCTDRQGDKE